MVGFGSFGQVVGRLLMANNKRITVLERDISAVSLMRKYGYKVYYGDATELELLRAAGAENAQSIVITCNDPEDSMTIVHLCQQHFPPLELGRKALISLGMHPHQAQRAQQHFRRLVMRMLRELVPSHDDSVQVSRVREARRELEDIFQREMQHEKRQFDGWDDE